MRLGIPTIITVSRKFGRKVRTQLGTADVLQGSVSIFRKKQYRYYPSRGRGTVIETSTFKVDGLELCGLPAIILFLYGVLPFSQIKLHMFVTMLRFGEVQCRFLYLILCRTPAAARRFCTLASYGQVLLRVLYTSCICRKARGVTTETNRVLSQSTFAGIELRGEAKSGSGNVSGIKELEQQ